MITRRVFKVAIANCVLFIPLFISVHGHPGNDRGNEWMDDYFKCENATIRKGWMEYFMHNTTTRREEWLDRLDDYFKRNTTTTPSRNEWKDDYFERKTTTKRNERMDDYFKRVNATIRKGWKDIFQRKTTPSRNEWKDDYVKRKTTTKRYDWKEDYFKPKTTTRRYDWLDDFLKPKTTTKSYDWFDRIYGRSSTTRRPFGRFDDNWTPSPNGGRPVSLVVPIIIAAFSLGLLAIAVGYCLYGIYWDDFMKCLYGERRESSARVVHPPPPTAPTTQHEIDVPPNYSTIAPPPAFNPNYTESPTNHQTNKNETPPPDYITLAPLK